MRTNSLVRRIASQISRNYLPRSRISYHIVQPMSLFSSSVQAFSTDIDPSLFSYTSGRFIFNERIRLAERHVEFNVEELKKAATGLFQQKHGVVRSIKKLAEGGFNRVFLLKMEDGFEMIAKIPYYIARPKYYATASEAATMTFLRSKNIPVPEVYAYCAKASNPVGTEYILMEKAPGICARDKWTSLDIPDIRRLAHSLVQLETILFQISFGATGSIYFKNDIQSDLQAPLYRNDDQEITDAQFCIGPIADYTFWYGRRSSLNVERGPWKDCVDYLKAIARKEISWTKQYGEPIRPKFPYNLIDGLSVQQPRDYLRHLEQYVSLTPHLMPKDSTHPFNTPTLRHPDLTPGNMFIDPDTGRISCLIDWQHTIVQPRLLAAGFPAAFQTPDIAFGPKLVEPKLPENLGTLSIKEQDSARDLYRKRQIFFAYHVFNGGLNRLNIDAIRDPMLRLRHLLVDHAGRQWLGNNVTLRGAVIRTTEFWSHLPDVAGIECPVQFEEGELDQFAELETDWINMNIAEEHYRQRICNMTGEGWVRNEDYEQAKAQLQTLKDEFWRDCDGDEREEHLLLSGWPFQDHEEVD